MFDSVRYRMYAAVDDAVIPSGLLARIILEKRDGDIAYHIDLPEPFDLRLVEDEAGCFDPAKPVGTPPAWLLVRGDEAPRPGMPCLTLAVTALDGVNESGGGACGRRDRMAEGSARRRVERRPVRIMGVV